MKKIIIKLTVVSMLLADEKLPPITIKADSNGYEQSAKVDSSDLSFASTLKRFSGFNQTSTTQLGTIEGADSRFTAVSWEGIVLKDSTTIDRQQTNINHLLLNSSGVRVAHGAVGAIYGAGASGIINISDKANAPSSVVMGGSTLNERFLGGRYKIASSKLTGYIAAENRYANSYTAVSGSAGKLDKSSEKDSVNQMAFRGVVTAKITDEINATIKALNSKTKENYDAGFPTNPDDLSFWNHNLAVYALEIDRSDEDGFYQKVALHTTESRRENHSTTRSDYSSDTSKLLGEFGRKWDKTDLKVGANAQKERGEIVDQFSPLKSSEATQNEIYFDAKTKLENNLIARVVARNTLFDSDAGGKDSANSHYALAGYDDGKFTIGASHATTTQAPSLVQIINPYGASNFDLKAEKLTQTRVFAGVKTNTATVLVEAFATKVDDYINWVDNPDWTKSGYENVDYYKHKGAKISLEFIPTDEFVFYANYTDLFDYRSSAANPKNRIPTRTVATGFEYDNGKFALNYDLKATSNYKENVFGVGEKNMRGMLDDTLAVKYKTDAKQTIELAVKNTHDGYREKAYGFTPPNPKRSFFLAVKQEF